MYNCVSQRSVLKTTRVLVIFGSPVEPCLNWPNISVSVSETVTVKTCTKTEAVTVLLHFICAKRHTHTRMCSCSHEDSIYVSWVYDWTLIPDKP